MIFTTHSGDGTGRAAAAGIPWDYRKVLLGHSINDITGHYSAPELLKLLEEAEKITRNGAVVVKPDTKISHSCNVHDLKKTLTN